MSSASDGVRDLGGSYLEDGASGLSELLKVSVGAVLLLFDCALLTALALCCGCPRCAHWLAGCRGCDCPPRLTARAADRLGSAGAALTLACSTGALLGLGWLLWRLSCTEFDDDIDFPFGGTFGVKPAADRILIFPGWLLHRVEPSHVPSEHARVALSFNIRGVWCAPLPLRPVPQTATLGSRARDTARALAGHRRARSSPTPCTPRARSGMGSNNLVSLCTPPSVFSPL